jgi:WD40-like Beta Propeller Repeat
VRFPMDKRRRFAVASLAAASLVAAAAASLAAGGCGKSQRAGFGDDGDVGTGDDAAITTATDGGIASLDDASTPGFGDGGATVHNDFASPVFDTADGGSAAPSNAPALFGPPSQGAQSGGPCLVEPENDALFPRNWLRPRFRWTAPTNENLFELRLHAQNQQTDLVVYTSALSWTMPQSLWDSLRNDSNDVPLTVSIRGGAYSGGALATEALGSFEPLGIAPADAPGTIIYWTSADGTTLKGFQVGDETVGTTLVPSQVQQISIGVGGCVGCHTGAPDGEYSILSSDVNNWGDFLALVDPDAGTVGAAPPFLGAGAKATLAAGPLGISAATKAHWTQGDHVTIASDDTDLVWVDLEAADMASARGTLARNGTQTGGSNAVAPTWSHDGKSIVYTACAFAAGGRPGSVLGSVTVADPGSTADLFRVPYNDRQGGTITPVAGASSTGTQEYYPAYSPDDAYLVFNECPNDLSMYNQPQAEVYVIPSDGGTATRLRANDPPACASTPSPGITNSWPKWAPAVTTTPDGRSFYWVVFSSKRFGGAIPQLFLTGVMIDRGGALSSYGALYLWNQPSAEGNHTPAWEYFNVPPPPPPPIAK